jgi:putative transposase
MSQAAQLAQLVGVAAACAAFEVARANFYRARRPFSARLTTEHRKSASCRRLGAGARAAVLAVLHEERFADASVPEVWAALLDEGRYLCSISTMYRLLRGVGESGERRAQRRHPRYPVPRLVASGPNQVWSWDITKLAGPVKWLYFSLYVLLDIFSRYVVGWLVAEREDGELAGRLIAESCAKQAVAPGALTVHSDRGAPMKAKSLVRLLADLGVGRSLSRPRVSNDNPFSESQFKTLKYCPAFPERFGSLHDARAFCQYFFTWYNREHHHSGLALLTPESVHYGLAEPIIAERQRVLDRAFAAYPERFVKGRPRPLRPPATVWINPPAPATMEVISCSLNCEVSVSHFG